VSVPGGGEGRGEDSHIERTGVLIVNFEKNPLESRYQDPVL